MKKMYSVRNIPGLDPSLSIAPDQHHAVTLIVQIHFPMFDGKDESTLNCENCTDYRLQVCPGGCKNHLDVMRCMISH
jgi:hypothetical protein